MRRAWPSRLVVHERLPLCRVVLRPGPELPVLLLEAGHYLDRCRENVQVSKDDVLDSMEHRLSVLTGKLVASPASAAYCVLPRG